MRLILSALLMILPLSAASECFVSYKAKQDDPLRLHYGVAILEDECSIETAERVLPERLAKGGWQLLAIDAIVNEDELNEVKERAGDYFLTY